MIYLDHNATTPVSPDVLEAMRSYFGEDWDDPSSSYRFAAKLKRAMETAREQVADLPVYDKTVRPLRDMLEAAILSNVPKTELNGQAAEPLANTANIHFPSHRIRSPSPAP